MATCAEQYGTCRTINVAALSANREEASYDPVGTDETKAYEWHQDHDGCENSRQFIFAQSHQPI